MEQKIEPLRTNEWNWLAAQFENASRFIEVFSPVDAGGTLTLAALDRAFAAWIASNPADNKLINGIINCVGVAFGRFLVEGLGFQWVIATDKRGSDLAVYTRPGTGDVLVYPANFVAKRWERRETNFLAESYKKISVQIESIKKRE